MAIAGAERSAALAEAARVAAIFLAVVSLIKGTANTRLD
jgi:hypothetical protein